MIPYRVFHSTACAGTLVLALLAGCAVDPSPTARPRAARAPQPAPQPAPTPSVPLRIATAEEVRDCKLISRLGSLGPRLGETPDDSASRTRADVLAKAGELRATHLVWGEARFSYAPASSIGQAYRCAR